MADLLIVTRRDKTLLTPESDKGKKWLLDNMIVSPYGSTMFIQTDVLPEFVEHLKRDEIEFDER